MDILEKRTYERRLFDLDCSDLLIADEVIETVISVAADQGALTFGDAVINDEAVTYPDGTTTAAGKVIQVQINDGVIPGERGELLCTVRARFSTNLNPRLEATVLLRLTDMPE